MQDITNDDIIRAWNNASVQDIEQHGDEGDFTRQHLLNPALLKLLGDVSGKRVLDAGCGQGYLCRLLARRGAYVTGLEPAHAWYSYACSREQAQPLDISYIQQELSTFDSHPNTFDIVVANMVLMDIPDYRSAMHNCVRALKKDGRFIFSLTHPCFEESAQEWQKKGYVEVRDYFNERAVPSRYGFWFHRPLSQYINLVLKEGCVLVEMVEPQLRQAIVQQHGEQHARNAHVPQFLLLAAQKEHSL